MSVVLIKGGVKKEVATGFSWKSLFFGCLYPLFAGDFKGFWRHFFYSSFTLGFSWLFTPFFYNKRKLKTFLEDGHKPYDLDSKNYLVKKIKYVPTIGEIYGRV